MICAGCNTAFEGTPLLLPSLSRQPFHFCGKTACAKVATRRAYVSWGAAVRARQTRRRRGA